MYMNMITTTELRTQVPLILTLLSRGETVDLVHRSRVVGEIAPKKYPDKPFNAKRVKQLVEKMNLPVLSQKEIDQRYRKYMMDRYGKYLPRHK